MTLSLLNNFERDFTKPFFAPAWFKEVGAYNDHQQAENYLVSSQMKYDDESTSWRLTVEVAGVTKQNLKVDTKEGHLFVTGEKTKGISLGKFEKIFKLPDGIDLEKIEAAFEDGVLVVTLPLESQRAPKAILVK